MNASATVYFLNGSLPKAKVYYPLHHFEQKKQLQLQPSAQQQYIHRRHLLKQLLTVHGLEPNLLMYHPSGKPYLNAPNQYISMSHDADYWIILLSNHPVGVDIQQRPPKFPKRFAAYFHCHESDILNNWMIREAYVKLTDSSLYQTRHKRIEQLIQQHQLCIYPIPLPDTKIYAVSTCKSLKISTQNMNTVF